MIFWKEACPGGFDMVSRLFAHSWAIGDMLRHGRYRPPNQEVSATLAYHPHRPSSSRPALPKRLHQKHGASMRWKSFSHPWIDHVAAGQPAMYSRTWMISMRSRLHRSRPYMQRSSIRAPDHLWKKKGPTAPPWESGGHVLGQRKKIRPMQSWKQQPVRQSLAAPRGNWRDDVKPAPPRTCGMQGCQHQELHLTSMQWSDQNLMV